MEQARQVDTFYERMHQRMRKRYDREKEQAEKKQKFLLSVNPSVDPWGDKVSSFHKVSPLKSSAENKDNVSPRHGAGRFWEAEVQSKPAATCSTVAGHSIQPPVDEDIQQVDSDPGFNSTDFLNAALGENEVQNHSSSNLFVASNQTLTTLGYSTSNVSSHVTQVESELLTVCNILGSESISISPTTSLDSYITSTDNISTTPSVSFTVPELIPTGTEAPMYHTIKEYRASVKAKRRSILPTPLPSPIKFEETLNQKSPSNIQLLDILLKQASILQNQIMQASKAVELCRTQVDFTTSEELVEAERLLLVTILHKQVVMDFIKVIHYEDEPPEITEKAKLSLSNIVLYLKPEFVSANKTNGYDTWFFCIASHGENVAATHAICELQEDCVNFLDPLMIPDLGKDFNIRLEVYSLRLKRRKILDKDKTRSLRRRVKAEKSSLFQWICSSWKLGDSLSDSEGIVDSSAFKLSGELVLNSNHLGQDIAHVLSRVPLSSPLSGHIDVSMKTSVLELCVKHEGFLNLLQLHGDSVSWTLVWCRLVGHMLRYWDTANIQPGVPPTGAIDLRGCLTGIIGLAERSLCPRRNTLVVAVSTTTDFSDGDTILRQHERDHTVVRYFLNASSKKECEDWCRKLSLVASTLDVFKAR